MGKESTPNETDEEVHVHETRRKTFSKKKKFQCSPGDLGE